MKTKNVPEVKKDSKTWFVTRHPGAVFWANEYGIKVSDGGIVADLDVKRIKANDQVIGTLPINLAAAVIERGARYVHLSMEVPATLRGKELTKEQMKSCRARLEAFDVQSLGRLTKRQAPESPTVMVVIASDQILQNILPLLAMKPAPMHVYILVSKSERAQASARKLESFCRRRGFQVSVIRNMPDSPLEKVKQFVTAECVATIQQRYPKATIVLNATGGTKLMSAGAASAIERLGEVIYCDTANQQIEFLSPKDQPAFALPPDVLSLTDYFSAQGVRLLAGHRASLDTNFRRQVNFLESTTRRIVALLTGNAGATLEKSIARINYAVSKVYDQRTNTWAPVQPIDSVDASLRAAFEESGIGVKFEAGKIRFPSEATAPSKAAVAYMLGGWLEHYCYLVMRDSGLDQRFWDCNIEINAADAPTPDGLDLPINEIDLAVTWRNRILIVECKTGSQIENNSLEITAKLKAIRDYAGGTLADAMVLSSNGFMSAVKERNARQREKLLGIKLHTREGLKEFPRLISEWLGPDFSKGRVDALASTKQEEATASANAALNAQKSSVKSAGVTSAPGKNETTKPVATAPVKQKNPPASAKASPNAPKPPGKTAEGNATPGQNKAKKKSNAKQNARQPAQTSQKGSPAEKQKAALLGFK